MIKKIRDCKKYKIWKEEVFLEKGKNCEFCGINGDCIQIHHKKKLIDIINKNNINTIEDAYKCNDIWDVNNAVVLCSCCHIELHIKLKLEENNRNNILFPKV